MARKKRSRAAPRLASQLRERILAAFSEKAKRSGLRSVTMGELATEMHISASTLYREFSSKEELTMACVERWAADLAVAEAASPKNERDGFKRFLHWAETWAEVNAALSPAFILDLRSDYPEAWKRFRAEIIERRRRGRIALRPLVRSDLDESVAFATLRAIMDHVLQPDAIDRLQVPRREAIRQAIAIWAGGALERKGKLRALRGGKG